MPIRSRLLHQRSPAAPTGDQRLVEALAARARDQQPIARLFEMTNDPLAALSLDGRFRLLNPAWETVLGWSLTELTAGRLQDFLHPDDVEQSLSLIATGRNHAARILNFTNRFRHRDGSWRWLLWSARCDGDLWYAAAKDVTDRIWLERQALHDPLTRLPNRLLLMDRAHQALTRMRRARGPVALLFIDLDRFKSINDGHGHAVGDELLIGVAERLAELLRDSDTVARLGGDEFVILAEDLEGDAEALAIAERVLVALERPFAVGSSAVSMSASVGISISHDPDSDTEILLREADVAMYRAKSTGGRGLEVFDEHLRREVSTQLDIETRLRDALPNRELALHYQPIVRLEDERPVACEALLRWRPRGAAATAPATFIRMAERSGLILQIGQWALEEACTQLRAWRSQGQELSMALNVSSRGLAIADLDARLAHALARHELPAEALWIEVTERAINQDPERARVTLQAVRALGVKVALDNFGAGPSSMSLAASLPLDLIKLDRSLLDGCEGDAGKRAIIVALLAFAAEAGVDAVAVGIETESQRRLVRELGCPLGQGFLLGEPCRVELLALSAG